MTTFAVPSPTAAAVPADAPAGPKSLLLVEDNPIDALRTMALLRSKVPDMPVRHVRTLAEATPELLEASDCVLLDLTLPDAKHQEAVKAIMQRSKDLPVVVLTGCDDPLKATLESIRNGAQDYLIKDGLDAATLERAIKYAIERNGFQAHLAAAAVLSVATALTAKGAAASTAAIAAEAEAKVEAAAVAAATAAGVARAAVDVTAAVEAVAAADAAALTAVVGAAEVASTARTAATAAADAAIASATAQSAAATASAAAARDASTALAAKTKPGAAGTGAPVAGRPEPDLPEANGRPVEQAVASRPERDRSRTKGHAAEQAVTEQSVKVALDDWADDASERSLRLTILVLVAKLAIALAVVMTIVVLLMSASAS